ncbi:unnamed protein product [Colias eurytheme]|nr:unnamed protein product [Colias eurytheme]
MCRLFDPEDEDIEIALCSNAGELLDPKTAYQLALGNLEPFTLKKMDDWDPDHRETVENVKTSNWKEVGIAKHPSIWNESFTEYLTEKTPWCKPVKKLEPIISAPQTRPRKKVVNLVSKYVPETQDESLSIETLSNMYCTEPTNKKQKLSNESETYTEDTQNELNTAVLEENRKDKSPILENKQRSFRKCLKNGSYSILKRFSKFPRTILDENVIESKFFANDTSVVIEESPEKVIKDNSDDLESSQKENSLRSPVRASSPILEPSPHRNPFRKIMESQESVVENTYPMEQLVTPVDSQVSYGDSPEKQLSQLSQFSCTSTIISGSSISNKNNNLRKNCKVPGLKRSSSLPSNQPTLLSKFGFQKKPVLRK